MTAIKSALIVGGGIAGMSAAITLAQRAIATDLVEADPQWRVYGAGITISGATLRAFQQLGVFDEVAEQAYAGDGIRICDREGHELALLPTPRPQGADVPGSGGIMRPVLHAILSRRVRSNGTRVRLGVTVQAFQQRSDGVEVLFSDGSAGRYDLLIGADGLFSHTRTQLLGPTPPPTYTGQCIWRAVLARPAQIDRRHFFLGGPCKVGLSPVSQQQMYMFLLEPRPDKHALPDAQLTEALKQLLSPYGGILRTLRESIGLHSRIILRPLEIFSLPPPWYQGRAVLIGDAAHPTTPQLASGAGMAVEDALVLSQELAAHTSVDQALQAFMSRRHERCRLVVENSIEIGRREQAGAPIEAQTQLVEQSLRVLAAPI